MATLFSETWTGSDDDPWDTGSWSQLGELDSSVVSIQGNTGELNPGGANYTACRISYEGLSASNYSIRFQFQFGTAGAQFHTIIFRHDGVWSSSNYDTMENSYSVQFDYPNYAYFLKTVSDSRTYVTTIGSQGFDLNVWEGRIECDGSDLRVRWWPQGDSEPGTWKFEESDAAIASGYLVAFASFNAAATTARPIQYDNLVIESLAPVYEQTDYRFYADDGDTI